MSMGEKYIMKNKYKMENKYSMFKKSIGKKYSRKSTTWNDNLTESTSRYINNEND